MVRVTGLDHIVLTTPDVERALAWYTGTLGLAGERVDEWRAGDVPFPSVRVDEGTIIDLFPGDGGNGALDHVCLVVDGPLEDVASGLPVERGPVEVFGARGMGRAVYVRDPDGNLLELRVYG